MKHQQLVLFLFLESLKKQGGTVFLLKALVCLPRFFLVGMQGPFRVWKAGVPEWTIGVDCKSTGEIPHRFESCPQHMEKNQMERLADRSIFTSQVERNKAASRLVHAWFPKVGGTPQHGDIQRVIIALSGTAEAEAQAKAAGNWWLWARTLMIENTFTKRQKQKVVEQAIEAARTGAPIHFVSARSPELLHAQVPGQGDASLPRSRKAIEALAGIVKKSSSFMPTKLTVAFADLAIDNLDEIKKVCDPEEVILENIRQIEELCRESGIESFEVIRLSDLEHPQGKMKDLLDPSGEVKIPVDLSQRALDLIKVVTKESSESHKRMFGWSEEQSREHNRNLGITMGLVGQAISKLSPPPILIHNEAFILRGALNNLFTDERDPLPVFCLRTLLETKRAKF